MDKRGEGGETLLGWVLLAAFVIIAIGGFLSPNACDKLLIVVSLCGLLWLFFGSHFLMRSESGGFVFFLFLALIILVGWTALRGSGSCDNVSQAFNFIMG